MNNFEERDAEDEKSITQTKRDTQRESEEEEETNSLRRCHEDTQVSGFKVEEKIQSRVSAPTSVIR